MYPVIWALVLVVLGGCATAPYRYGGNYCTDCDAPLKEGESQVERGRPAPVVDTVGWIVGVPAKIIMLDRHIDNHDVSFETEARLQQYLACNDLDKVKVRLNQYDPCGEWNRLVENKSVAWPLRYTVGTLSVVGYTLLPGRVLGGDRYNPFTNTVSIYSDAPAVAVYEGAVAKDYAQREYKGLYAVAGVVPGVGAFWHDARASSDAMGYIRENGTSEDIKEGYRSVYPTYAIRASAPFGSIGDVPVTLGALVAGHVAGQVKAAMEPKNESPVVSEPATAHAASSVPWMTARTDAPIADACLMR